MEVLLLVRLRTAFAMSSLDMLHLLRGSFSTATTGVAWDYEGKPCGHHGVDRGAAEMVAKESCPRCSGKRFPVVKYRRTAHVQD